MNPLESIARVTRRLRRLEVPHAFLGGAIVSLLVDDPELHQSRPTLDVDAIVQVITQAEYAALEQRLRDSMRKAQPNVKLSFEPIELTNKILAQGSPTPIEVALTGKNKKQNVIYGFKVMKELRKIPYLRDVQIAQSYKYPSIDVDIDRVRAAELGVSVGDVSRTLTAATSSSTRTRRCWPTSCLRTRNELAHAAVPQLR